LEKKISLGLKISFLPNDVIKKCKLRKLSTIICRKKKCKKKMVVLNENEYEMKVFNENQSKQKQNFKKARKNSSDELVSLAKKIKLMRINK
jgi:hypothetical protein